MGCGKKDLGKGIGGMPTRGEAGKRRRSHFNAIRPFGEALAVFALCLIASLTLSSAQSAANPYRAHSIVAQFQMQTMPTIAEEGDRPLIEIATTSSVNSPDAVFRRTSWSAAWILLSLAFSIVATVNLALVRHMRHAYVKPRSRLRA